MAIKKKQETRGKRENLRGRRILITAGPTWVPIDSVRVISNIATGRTGIILARQARKKGAKVTLFLGPSNINLQDKSIDIRHFKFFNDLRKGIIKELSSRHYDIIIHSAAVSDFKPERQYRKKLASGQGHNLKLLPLPKIVKDIRRLARQARLIMFKLESGVSDKLLIKRAKEAQVKTGADFVVANRIKPYRAFLINNEGEIVSLNDKVKLANKLLEVTG